LETRLGPLRLLVDDAAARGAADRALEELSAALAERDVTFDVTRTRTAQMGAAARDAAGRGLRYLAVVGGDAALHAVVNALVTDEGPVEQGVVLGLVPTGTDCDFARTFGMNRSPAFLARHLAGESTMDLDVGVAAFTGPDGRPASRRFANVAQVGYGAEAVRRQARLPRALGRVGALLAAYGAILATSRPQAEVAVAHTTVRGPLVNLVVANGQFHSGGAKVAPRALPDDGRFNVQVFSGERAQVFLQGARIAQGEHLPDPAISEYQSPTVEVTSPAPLPVEADGQYLGTTPASFRLLPGALRLKL
jgi:YegS/Rv2252/BmrU family lipid kinase